MIALSLPDIEVKKIMNLLLKADAFDDFGLRSFSVVSFARLDIDGAVPTEQDEQFAKQEYNKWRLIRPYVFGFIKGRERPRAMKAVLSFPHERLATEFPGAAALFVNIVFDKNELHITTGCALNSFTLDRSLERSWDNFVTVFLRGRNVNFTIL